jgi:hypothetical protein
MAATARPAFAQFDLAGQWARRSGEDARALGAEGAHIGDYTGIPLNTAGRIRAETWDASVWSEKERQAEPHSSQYFMVGIGRIQQVLDPVTKELVAYTMCCQFAGEERTVWLDGRPHPGPWAEHTWQGFSTGKWNGNVLTVTTTHMKTGTVNRNGTPASAKSVMTEHFIRHGDQLTVVQIVDDPAYFDEPFIRTLDFVRNPNPPGPAGHQILEIIDEITDWPKGYVPSYALGAKHSDWAESVGLPFEASRGGMQTLYPEYVLTLRKMVGDYQASKAAPQKPAQPSPVPGRGGAAARPTAPAPARTGR